MRKHLIQFLLVAVLSVFSAAAFAQTTVRGQLVDSARLSELSEEEKGIAYELLNRLADGAVDENYTMLDYMQMARLYYNLGELSNNLFGEQDNPHYKKAIYYLEKGGIDLSMNKWLELISLRTIE